MQRQQALLHALDVEYTEPVRDPVWKHIHLSPPLLRLVDTAEFQKLNRIRQLGPTYLVYPGATHTRFNHSLGVFHIARRLLQQLLRHSETPPLSGEGVRAFLAAALLHDVGHFPYTHSFKTLPLTEHEQLTGRLVQSGDLARRIRSGLGVEPKMVAAIVDESLDDQSSEEVQLYRRLLSGSLDPDKLDYLNRDAYFCGIPYGLQDIDFALNRVVPTGYDGIAVDEAGITAVENILFSKYLMYRAVYWHRTVRVATAMIRKAVFLALREGVITAEDLYGLDDELLLSRVAVGSFPPLDLIRRVGSRDLLKPVADLPFDGSDPHHRRLEDGAYRLMLESRIAASLRKGRNGTPRDHEVIIDLPDAVSFEAEFPIVSRGETLDFPRRSVFSGEVVTRFTEVLRRIRLILPESVAETLPDSQRLLVNAVQDNHLQDDRRSR